MRASRLLQMLLLLQNRGRMTSQQLADELEVAPRTILRDVDAMTEAGLPIIVFQGNQGGIELGFNYRTRLTGLDADEAEALGAMLSLSRPALTALGMSTAAARATAKLIESFPDRVRACAASAYECFQINEPSADMPDPRIEAMAAAVKGRRIVRIKAKSADPKVLHPIALRLGRDGWAVVDGANDGAAVPMSAWIDINISSKTFEPNDKNSAIPNR